MKKMVLAMLMVTLLPSFSYGATEIPLLPEVKKALEVPLLDERAMAKNSYVYLLSIDAKDRDYFNIAKKYLIENNQWLKEIDKKNYDKGSLLSYPSLTHASTLDMTIDGKRYVFPCNTREQSVILPTCLTNILTSKQQMRVLINKNKKILTRYEQVISLPDYYAYNYSNYPKNQIFLFQLELLNAIYAIDEGEITQGLDILQQQINFVKKGFVSTDMASRVVARSSLIQEYRVVSDLLNAYPRLVKEPDLAKIRALLESLPDYNLNLKEAMLNKRSDILFINIVLSIEAKREAAKRHLTYDLSKTLNRFYLSYEPYITFTQLTLPERRHIYLTNEPISHFKECTIEENTFIGDCDKDNIIGDFYATAYVENSTKSRFYQLYDVYNYLALVNLQLDILAKGLKAEQVPDFLTSAGDKAVNIMTKKPFVWNKKDLTISTDYLTLEDDGKQSRLAVKVNIQQ